MKTRTINSGIINKNFLLKSIVYRIYSSLIVFLISFVVTGNLLVSFSIGFLETIVKLFSYYLFDEVWSRMTGFKANPSVIWLAGSSENNILLANHLTEKLKTKGIYPVFLNRDEIKIANEYKKNHEMENFSGMEISQLASLFKSQGNVVIVTSILPSEEIKNDLKKKNIQFLEVTLSTDVNIYSRKSSSSTSNFNLTGSTQFLTDKKGNSHFLKNSHIIFDSDGHSMEESISKLLKILRT